MPRPRPENAAFHALAAAGRVDWRLPNRDIARACGVTEGVVQGKRLAVGLPRRAWATRSPVTPDRAAARVGMRVAADRVSA